MRAPSAGDGIDPDFDVYRIAASDYRVIFGCHKQQSAPTFYPRLNRVTHSLVDMVRVVFEPKSYRRAQRPVNCLFRYHLRRDVHARNVGEDHSYLGVIGQ